MAYTTITGREVPYTWQVAAEVYGNIQKASSEEAKHWMSSYKALFDETRELDLECATLRRENQRLRHENEFMLRLVNEGVNHE